MPLHRGIDGELGRIDERSLRATGNHNLPAGLVSEVRLLAPDPEVANLYHDVPVLDDDRILREMLASTRHFLAAFRP